MSLLTYELTLNEREKTVRMRIIEQAHRRPKESSEYTFHASNGIYIKSCGSPALDSDVVYLRGTTTSKDNDPATRQFRSLESARLFVSMMQQALAEWASIGGFERFSPDTRNTRSKMHVGDASPRKPPVFGVITIPHGLEYQLEHY